MSQAGLVDIESSNPQILTSVTTDDGIAIPIANNLEILGVTVANATYPQPTWTTGSGNTVDVNLQVGAAVTGAPVDKNDAGLVSFDDTQFTVDANGYVQLIGGGVAIDSINVDAHTAPGTDPVVPNGAGQITVTGNQVAANTIANCIQTNSIAASEYTIEIQRSSAKALSTVSANGVCHFDSTSFSVDGSAFVQLVGGGFTWNDVSGAFSPLKNNGYFITGTATANLPATPSQGDTIKFFVDHATQVLTIDAPGTQIIRFGSAVTAAGGTAVSTARGDSVELTYRSSDTCWCAIGGFSGIWTLT